MRVLLIQNENFENYALLQNFKSQGYIVDQCQSNIMQKYETNDYDALFFDTEQVTTTKIIQLIRMKNWTIPIIILGSQNKEEQTKLYRIGIDHYIAKPFYFEEIHSKLHSIHRRLFSKKQCLNKITIDTLTIDFEKQQVERDCSRVQLTQKEYMILLFMCKRQGTILSRTKILQHLWKSNYDVLHSNIDVHICKLRKKIDKGFQKKLIHTMHGRGYKIENI